MFNGGKRQQGYSKICVLPASGRLLPEFDLDKRRSIKDMFARKPTTDSSRPGSKSTSTAATTSGTEAMKLQAVQTTLASTDSTQKATSSTTGNKHNPQLSPRKRSQGVTIPSSKRTKLATITTSEATRGGQKTMKGFFEPKATQNGKITHSSMVSSWPGASSLKPKTSKPLQHSGVTSLADSQGLSGVEQDISGEAEANSSAKSPTANAFIHNESFIDPIVSKEDWLKLFNKKPAPPCDGHQEPCTSLTTKKPGLNRGRSFWICSRPLGPSGEKEKGTQWRCPTFIWASDWNSSDGSY